MAAAFLEREEAEGFADAAEGDVEGLVIGGGVEEAVQAGVEQVQAVQQGGLVNLVPAAALDLDGAARCCRGGRGPRGSGRIARPGAVGRGGQQTLVDLPAFGVVADGTAFDHTCAPKGEFPQEAGWVSGYQGKRGRASTGGIISKKTSYRRHEDSYLLDFCGIRLLGNYNFC